MSVSTGPARLPAPRTGATAAEPAPEPAARRTPAWAITILVLSGMVYLGLSVDAVLRADSELIQALTVTPILLGLTLPFAFRIARNDRDPSMATIIMAAAAAKFLMGYVRFKIAYGADAGRTDAQQYDAVGQVLAPAFRRLDFSANIGSLVGTGFVKYLTGIVYAIFGYGRIGGFLVFAWIGFLGFLLLTRAFKIGVPTGEIRRYTIAVLFLPSLLYWPAIIGKEAWMLLGIGLASYGIAGMFAGRTGAAIPFGVGMLATFAVRPHMGLALMLGLAVALLVRRAPARTFASPMLRMVALALVLLLGLFIASRTASFFERTAQVEGGSISATLSQTAERSAEETTEAGSAFSPVRVNTPIDMGPAFVTVMFRPFPFEASSATALLSAAEGVFLMAWLAASWRRLRSVPRMLRTHPYVTYSLAYPVVFAFAVSTVATFGILARQRVQAIPFLLVFIALPKYRDLLASVNGSAGPAETVVAAPAPTARTIGPSGTRRRLRPDVTARGRVPVSSGSEFPPPARAPA